MLTAVAPVIAIVGAGIALDATVTANVFPAGAHAGDVIPTYNAVLVVRSLDFLDLFFFSKHVKIVSIVVIVAVYTFWASSKTKIVG